MTWEQFALDFLEKNGVGLESQRTSILEHIKADEANSAMRDQWHKPVEMEGLMRAVLILSIKRSTVDWIDQNLPKAFFRPMFA